MMSVLQFCIPSRAAAAIDFAAMQRRAREAGVAHWWLERNERHAGPGKTRLTCQREHALLLVGELVPIAETAQRRGDTDLLLACAEAARVALEVLDREIRNPPGASPASGLSTNPMQA